jgi:DNA-binding XRE family transcriptional regulator
MQLPPARAPPGTSACSASQHFSNEERRRSVYLKMDGEKIRSLREAKGMTRTDLAAVAGISVSTAERVEREKLVLFSTGRAVAEALGAAPSPSLGRVLGRE